MSLSFFCLCPACWSSSESSSSTCGRRSQRSSRCPRRPRSGAGRHQRRPPAGRRGSTCNTGPGLRRRRTHPRLPCRCCRGCRGPGARDARHAIAPYLLGRALDGTSYATRPWPSCPRRRTWGDRTRSSPRPCVRLLDRIGPLVHTARPESRAGHCTRISSVVPLLWRLLHYRLDPHRPQEHSVALLAVEVALPLDGAIVLARGLLELDADPVAGLEGCVAHEADAGVASVVEFDELADCEGGGVHGRSYAVETRGPGIIGADVPSPGLCEIGSCPWDSILALSWKWRSRT